MRRNGQGRRLLSSDLEDRVTEARRLREQAGRSMRAASEATRRLARDLLARGLTLRETGQVLGLSHQRVAQLVATGRAEAVARETTARARRRPAAEPSGAEPDQVREPEQVREPGLILL